MKVYRINYTTIAGEVKTFCVMAINKTKARIFAYHTTPDMATLDKIELL